MHFHNHKQAPSFFVKLITFIFSSSKINEEEIGSNVCPLEASPALQAIIEKTKVPEVLAKTSNRKGGVFQFQKRRHNDVILL